MGQPFSGCESSDCWAYTSADDCLSPHNSTCADHTSRHSTQCSASTPISASSSPPKSDSISWPAIQNHPIHIKVLRLNLGKLKLYLDGNGLDLLNADSHVGAIGRFIGAWWYPREILGRKEHVCPISDIDKKLHDCELLIKTDDRSAQITTLSTSAIVAKLLPLTICLRDRSSPLWRS